MARNRKRAKERRDRRPQAVGGRSGLATARSNGAEGIPSPIEHAAPDAELADAQLALGRVGELQEEPVSTLAAEEELDVAGAGGAGGGSTIGGDVDGDGGMNPPGGAVPLPAPSAAPTRPRARLLAFLEGSWRELQRVQWPDRRQVMQATAVVLGFVIVAGVFLGVADTVSSHFMNAILVGGDAVWLWVGVGIIVSSLVVWTFTQRDR
jgi:preprotein translocase subunit SecE